MSKDENRDKLWPEIEELKERLTKIEVLLQSKFRHRQSNEKDWLPWDTGGSNEQSINERNALREVARTEDDDGVIWRHWKGGGSTLGCHLEHIRVDISDQGQWRVEGVKRCTVNHDWYCADFDFDVLWTWTRGEGGEIGDRVTDGTLSRGESQRFAETGQRAALKRHFDRIEDCYMGSYCRCKQHY